MNHLNYLKDRLKKDIIDELLMEYNDDLNCDKEKFTENL